MKTLQKTLLALTTGVLVTAGAQAAVNYTGSPYVGVKAGQFLADLDNVDNDNPTAYGVYGGYNFDPNVGVELEYMTSSDADVNEINNVDVDGEFNVQTYGAYATYRYHFPSMNGLYAKGKLGIAKTEAEATAKTVGFSRTVKSDDTGLAGGVGLGFSVSPNLSVEGEYALVDSDADLLTLGAHFKF